MRLKQLCRSQHFNISSTFFKQRLLHRYTWYSNDKKTRKILDHISSEKYIQNYMVDCSVYRGFHVETDHQLLKATIYVPRTRKSRKKFCNNPKPPKRRVNLKMLIDKRYTWAIYELSWSKTTFKRKCYCWYSNKTQQSYWYIFGRCCLNCTIKAEARWFQANF